MAKQYCKLIFLLLTFLIAYNLFSQSRYQLYRIAANIKLDRKLTESEWQLSFPLTDIMQIDPF